MNNESEREEAQENESEREEAQEDAPETEKITQPPMMNAADKFREAFALSNEIFPGRRGLVKVL